MFCVPSIFGFVSLKSGPSVYNTPHGRNRFILLECTIKGDRFVHWLSSGVNGRLRQVITTVFSAVLRFCSYLPRTLSAQVESGNHIWFHRSGMLKSDSIWMGNIRATNLCLLDIVAVNVLSIDQFRLDFS